MQVNVGEAKSNLSKLLARVEAGEIIEIARSGVPVARLTRIEPAEQSPGHALLAALAAPSGEGIRIGDDFEFTESELDEIYANPIVPE